MGFVASIIAVVTAMIASIPALGVASTAMIPAVLGGFFKRVPLEGEDAAAWDRIRGQRYYRWRNFTNYTVSF